VVDGLTTDIRRRDVERACIEEKQRLLRDIEVAEAQLAAGQGIPHERAVVIVLAALSRSQLER
jgi:hypothetical protein